MSAAIILTTTTQPRKIDFKAFIFQFNQMDTSINKTKFEPFSASTGVCY